MGRHRAGPQRDAGAGFSGSGYPNARGRTPGRTCGRGEPKAHLMVWGTRAHPMASGFRAPGTTSKGFGLRIGYLVVNPRNPSKYGG
jgi:hypothetical protein